MEIAKFEWLCDVVIHNTQELIRKSINTPKWKYKPNKADFGSFRKFCDYYHEKYRKVNLSEEFLTEYMNKQFEWMFYRNEVTEHKLNSVRLTWFFGAKAIARWEGKLAEKAQTHYNKFRKNGLALERKYNNSVYDFKAVYPFEESEKKRYHNTEAGLAWCYENTNMFNRLSEYCATCVHSKDCVGLMGQQVNKKRNNAG